MLDFIDKPINPPGPYKFTVISTFAGCGGSSLGYKWAGGKVLAAVEWDENAVETYRLNHHGTPVMHRDITKVTVQELLDLTGLKSGELDIFDGSPPCQGFSTSGKRQFDDPRNSLFKEYVRLLKELQPKVFVMENVSGMVKGNMKHIFVMVMKELKASGYQVKCQLMNAMYFGVPQSRQRVIFIGVRNDLNVAPSYPQAQTKPIGIEEVCHHLKGRKINWCMYPGMVFDGVRPWHSSKEPAPTLSKSGNAAVYENGKLRGFTIKEAQLLASFPVSFSFVGKEVDGIARIGNSVPPMFMYHIAEHIYTHVLSKAILPSVEVSQHA